MSITKNSGGSSTKTMSFRVIQNNTFSNYQPVYFSGSIWALARANALNTMGTHIIINVSSTGFEVVQAGKITASSHGLGSAGDWLYVSEGSAGTLTATPPTIYSNPLLQVLDENTLEIHPYLASKISPDLPDPIPLIVKAVKQTTPSTGNALLYPKTKYGKADLYHLDDFGSETAFQTAFWQKQFIEVSPDYRTPYICTRGGGVNNNGTITYNTTYDLFSQITGATAGNVAGLFYQLAYYTVNKGFRMFADLTFLDAAYGEGATGFRSFVGFSADTISNVVGSDNRACERISFQISTNLNEANWMISCRDSGGTERRVSTGIAFVATHRYRFSIRIAPGGTTAYFRVDDVTAATTSGELTNTLNLPSAATALYAGHHICTLTTTARIIAGRKLYIEEGSEV